MTERDPFRPEVEWTCAEGADEELDRAPTAKHVRIVSAIHGVDEP